MSRYNSSYTASEVRSIRRGHDLTQVKFAEALGVSKNTVARWESGMRGCKGLYAGMIDRFTEDQKTNPESSALVRMNLELSQAQNQMLEKLATLTDRSRSAVIRRAIAIHLQLSEAKEVYIKDKDGKLSRIILL